MPDRTDRSGMLALPFTVLGLAGASLIADGFRAGSFDLDAGMRTWLCLFVPVACLVVGAALDSPLRSWRPAQALVAVAGGSGIAGFCVGVAMSIVWVGYLAVGPIEGLVVGLGFTPLFFVIALSARQVGRSRGGSLLDAMDRRSVWVMVAGSVVAGSLGSVPDWQASRAVRHAVTPDASLAIVGAATLALATLVLADIVTWYRVSATTRRVAKMRRRNPDAPAFGGRFIDLGVGEEVWEDAALASSPYRAADFVRAVVYGSPGLAMGPVIRGLRRSLLVTLAALVALGAAIAADLGGSPPTLVR